VLYIFDEDSNTSVPCYIASDRKATSQQYCWMHSTKITCR